MIAFVEQPRAAAGLLKRIKNTSFPNVHWYRFYYGWKRGGFTAVVDSTRMGSVTTMLPCLVSRPGQSQGLLYKWRWDWLIRLFILFHCTDFTVSSRPKGWRPLFQVQNILYTGLAHSRSKRTSTSLHCTVIKKLDICAGFVVTTVC